MTNLAGPPQTDLSHDIVSQSRHHVARMEAAAYFITFTTYGTRLHGDPRGSYERNRDDGHTYELEPHEARNAFEAENLREGPVTLDEGSREVVAETFTAVAAFKGWGLLGLNVRSNHVHIVITSDEAPERVMNTLKAWATRRLREAGRFEQSRRIWTRHGSTRRLWKDSEVEDVLLYVIEGQGRDLGGVRTGKLE